MIRIVLSAAWLMVATAWLVVAISSSEADDWLPFPTPSGAILVHRDCIHHVEHDFHVEAGSGGGDVLSHGPHLEALPPCPHAPKRLNVTTVRHSGEKAASAGYYSDWAAYTQSTHPAGLGFMSSDWIVPAAPKSSGPVPGMSSSYLFNGLENSGGKAGTATVILQPVLSYGKSGCVIDPLNFFQWHLISFLVTNSGRAYCGARLSVQEGEPLRGVMRLGEDGQTWTVESTRLSNNQTSTYTARLGDFKADTAYLTLETMINYSCEAFPASGSVTFSKNLLADTAGQSVRPEWVEKILHTECRQRVHVDAGGDVTIAWDADRSGAEFAPLVV